GGDADERRLFYVAMTRPRDWLSMSRHERVNVQAAAPSPYWTEHRDLCIDPSDIIRPSIEGADDSDDDPIAVSYSEMAAYLDCAKAYRLRSLMGFQPRLAPELGYGKAVHHVLRTVAGSTQASGTVPTADEI